MPRVCELNDGMMNAIGIPSKGAQLFIDKVVPFYRDYDAPLIVSISAPTAQGFADLAARLSDVPGVAGIEANISCPNLEAHGQSFGMQAESTRDVVELMRQVTSLPLWVKLTPMPARWCRLPWLRRRPGPMPSWWATRCSGCRWTSSEAERGWATSWAAYPAPPSAR